MRYFTRSEEVLTPARLRIRVKETKREIELRVYRGHKLVSDQRFRKPRGEKVSLYEGLRALYWERPFKCALSIRAQINYLLKRNGYIERS